MAFAATSGTRHGLIMDAAPEVGGNDTGPRPIELLLVGLGGCTGIDVLSRLHKMRQAVTSYEVRLTGERTSEHPRVFTTISVEHVVRGRGLSTDGVRRAVELSATRYCSAAAMLSKVGGGGGMTNKLLHTSIASMVGLMTALVISTMPVAATYPGENGRLAFGMNSGGVNIFSVWPDGTGSGN